MFKFYLVADAKILRALIIEKKNDFRNSFLPHDQEYNEILKNHFLQMKTNWMNLKQLFEVSAHNCSPNSNLK